MVKPNSKSKKSESADTRSDTKQSLEHTVKFATREQLLSAQHAAKQAGMTLSTWIIQHCESALTTAQNDGKQRNSRAKSFEALYSELTDTVRRLEDGSIPLEDAAKVYTKGMRLAAQCERILTYTKLKVSKIQPGLFEEPSSTDDGEDTEQAP